MRREVPTIRPIVPTPRGDAEWFAQSVEYYADNDAAQSGTIGSGQETWMQTTVVGPGNVSFRYKMSSVSGDALAFYVDENFKASWSQGSSWPWTGNFAVPSGTHTLKWKYYKYSGSTAGSAWIDAIQWSGGVPGSGGGADWEQITYTYDPSGRRIAKDVDGVVTRYLYDGDQCIAEYDANDVLLRKYIHGPSIDEPICMVEAAGGYAGTYYYHFDALGSVVALSDAAGDTVQVYEYDVYGQVAASDPNHPNRFLFTSREFDAETGLYYYRARYYNPAIGRFLQTDPIGYEDGMNWYAYCGNNSVCRSDPTGLWYHFTASDDGEGMKLVWETYTGEYREIGVWADIDEFIDEAYLGRIAEFGSGWERNELGWKLTEATSKFDRERKWWFWRLKALEFLDGSMASMYQTMENAKEKDGKTPFTVVFTRSYRNWYTPGTNLVEWRWTVDSVYLENEGCNANWNQCNALALLAHELTHAYVDAAGCPFGEEDQQTREREAVRTENSIRCSLFKLDPTEQETWPRPGYQPWVGDVAGATNAEQAWAKFNWEFIWKPIP